MSLPNFSTVTISDVKELRGRRVLVRVDLNLPYDGTKITDTTRLDALIPFIKELSFAGAKIILLSHFGEKGESIQPVADILMQKVSGITYIPGTDIAHALQAIEACALGDGILIENTRCFGGEEENLPLCARQFASLGDIFINEAFSVSHRKHASVVGIPKYLLSYLGPRHVQEITHLQPALIPEKPALLIVGGAKIKTKIGLIEHYLNQGVLVFVGGAMAHNILKQRGYEIGESLYDATCTLPESVYRHPLLVVPRDVILSDGQELMINHVGAHDRIVDCGKDTLVTLQKTIAEARTIIVNGPLGAYEQGWRYATEHMLLSVSQAQQAATYIGGGDTLDVAASINLLKSFGFVSLGGGAMLDFLASGTLPGIDAVTESHFAG